MATIEKYEIKAGTRYRVRYRDPEGNQTDKRGFVRKRDAEAFANELEVRKRKGTFVRDSDGRVTVAELYEEWTGHRTRTKETTDAKHESAWSVRVKKRWGDTQVGKITVPGVRKWVADMVAAGTGAASIETALGQLRMVLDLAVESHRIITNPAEKVHPPRRGHTRRGYLTHQQVEALAVQAATVTRVWRGRGDAAGRKEVTLEPIRGTIVRFLAYTGVRWGEMSALRVSDFDMLRRRIQVSRAVAEVKGKLVVSTPKSHERRSVPFPAFLAPELAALMRGKSRDALVFASTAGEPMRVSIFRPRVQTPAVKLCQADDPSFPTVTPHDLRHTAASLAISAGANVKAVQTMLGHKSAALTLDTYADLFPDDLDAVAVSLDAARAAAVPDASSADAVSS